MKSVQTLFRADHNGTASTAVAVPVFEGKKMLSLEFQSTYAYYLLVWTPELSDRVKKTFPQSVLSAEVLLSALMWERTPLQPTSVRVPLMIGSEHMVEHSNFEN